MKAQLQWATAAMRNGRRDGSVIAMGGGGSDEWRWWQWATAEVTMGHSDSGSTIPMAVNSGGAINGKTAATAQWQSP